MSKKVVAPVTLEEVAGNWGVQHLGHHAEVLPGKWIRLFGSTKKEWIPTVRHNVTFKLGDVVKYGCHRYGVLVGITLKNVTIEDPIEGLMTKGKHRRHKVSLADFDGWHFNYSLKKDLAENIGDCAYTVEYAKNLKNKVKGKLREFIVTLPIRGTLSYNVKSHSVESALGKAKELYDSGVEGDIEWETYQDVYLGIKNQVLEV